MRRFINILLVTLFALNLNYAFGQCKVAVKELSGTYKGDCKKGFANGHGEAVGVDKYVGDFKKGFPHGDGIYTWANGTAYDGEFKKGKMDGYGVLMALNDGEKIEKKGYWKYGYYGGTKKNVPVYKVINKKYVNNFSVKRIGDGNRIGFKWVKGSRTLYSMTGLTMTANSGIENIDMNFCGFDQIKFPLTCRLEYLNTDKAETMTYDCIFEFKLLIPGEYIITFKD